MTFAVCDFAQNSEYLVTMVKVRNAGTKVFHWTVIIAFETGSYSFSTQSTHSEAVVDWTCNSLTRASLLFDLHTET